MRLHQVLNFDRQAVQKSSYFGCFVQQARFSQKDLKYSKSAWWNFLENHFGSLKIACLNLSFLCVPQKKRKPQNQVQQRSCPSTSRFCLSGFLRTNISLPTICTPGHKIDAPHEALVMMHLSWHSLAEWFSELDHSTCECVIQLLKDVLLCNKTVPNTGTQDQLRLIDLTTS